MGKVKTNIPFEVDLFLIDSDIEIYVDYGGDSLDHPVGIIPLNELVEKLVEIYSIHVNGKTFCPSPENQDLHDTADLFEELASKLRVAASFPSKEITIKVEKSG